MTKTKELTISARFVNSVMAEFTAIAGNLPTNFGDKQKKLAQHLFIQINASLEELEKKRLTSTGKNKNSPPIAWANVNMQKLAIDAMRRVELGLDALIPNHIFIIPYLNHRTKKYDIDLRIGYVGQEYYRRNTAIEKPVDIRYELVHETDDFVVTKKDSKNDIESYDFQITNPFKRGPVVGAFGYIIYTDPTKNVLVIVSEEEFLKSQGLAQSDKFWGSFPEAMRYGKLVHRTTVKLRVDPNKVNQSYAAIEANERTSLIDVTPQAKIDANANKDVIDITTGEVTEPETPEPENEPPEPPQDETGLTDTEKKEIEKEEANGPGF